MKKPIDPARLGTLAVLLSAVSLSGLSHESLAVSADFPGGSAEVVDIDSGAHRLHLRPALHEGRGWPCWWYAQIDGAVTDREIAVTVSGHPLPFRPGGAALAAAWAQPIRAALSADGLLWTQTPDAEFDAVRKTATYRFPAPAERFWIAWSPPFLPSHAEALINRITGRLPDAERFVLAESRGGRPVPGIRIGNRKAPAACWVQARQHAWEAGSSWVGQGFLEWVSGDEPSARKLLDRCEIFFVPIMDVDNVTEGAGGKEAAPRDHNRDWSNHPHYPEVAAAQREISSLDENGRLRLFIDLHNPGPGDHQPFFFGPFGYGNFTGAARENYSRWIAVAAREMSGALPLMPAYKFATYVTAAEERGRMSAEWVRNHTNRERVVSVTLETSWNTRESTDSGYRDTGYRLARAAALYLGEP